MSKSHQLKLAIWNANGLAQHSSEVKTFLIDKSIDIMLVSETHFNSRSYLHIPKYTIYKANHPSGNARGGAAIIIKNDIKHVMHSCYTEPYIQSSVISILDGKSTTNIAAIYCPPNHSIKKDHFDAFFSTLGPTFIAGGDYNAKHTQWGSRLITPRGRELKSSMDNKNLFHVSTGEPTHWPTDVNKLPDVIDFCICKGIPATRLSMQSSLDLSSDHTPLIMVLGTEIALNSGEPRLHNKHTDWQLYRTYISDNLDTNLALKTNYDIENAVEHFNLIIQKAAWSSTPAPIVNLTATIDREITELLQKKRRLRRIWQITKSPDDKKKFNTATKQLKATLRERANNEMENYLANLSPCEASDYSLWKATRKFKNPTPHAPPVKMSNGQWARSNEDKANAFAIHLQNVFRPFASNNPTNDSKIQAFLETPYQMDLPIDKFTVNEIKWTIQRTIKAKKAPGYDLITGKALQELPEVGFTFINQLFNAVACREHFPSQWKVAQIILIPKPGKPQELVTSYRPISLLPTLSKVFEKVLLKRINKIINRNTLIPAHQFGFRNNHSTVEQINRVYQFARDALERKEYCTAAFLDITQAFDKVWHNGLLYKLKRNLPHSLYALLKTYILGRFFMVKIKDFTTDIFPIGAGVPQGSVLGPTLYTLYTADLPLSDETYTATFADDTVIMSKNNNPTIATQQLQNNMNSLSVWLNDWRIKANPSKSVQITFALRHGTCPAVYLDNCALPQSEHSKYLGVHFDRRLTWKHHIFTKRKQLGLKLRNLYWLLCPKSKLSLSNKILIYKAVLKPIWTYGVSIWGTAAKSNLDILQRFQSKMLRLCTNAPYYVTNDTLHHDLRIPTVYEDIRLSSKNYRTRLTSHPNPLAAQLITTNNLRRLRRYATCDLPTRQ